MRIYVGIIFLSACVVNSVNPVTLHEQGASARRPRCHPEITMWKLAKQPQAELGAGDKLVGIVTSPVKKSGLSGWSDTGCEASGSGVLVRDAVHSTEGFWTIDVRLVHFVIDGHAARANRFIRIEVAPDTKAHDVVSKVSITKGMSVAFGGPVLIDHDGPFLEVHPNEDFRVE